MSRPQLCLSLRDQGIQGTMLSVIKSLNKEHYVRVLHPHLPVNEYVEIERGLAEGSVFNPRLYSIFLSSLLHKLQTRFPGTTGARR